MKENENFNFQDKFFDEKLLNLIDLCEKTFPNNKSIITKVEEIKKNLLKQTRKVKIEKIERNNNKK